LQNTGAAAAQPLAPREFLQAAAAPSIALREFLHSAAAEGLRSSAKWRCRCCTGFLPAVFPSLQGRSDFGGCRNGFPLASHGSRPTPSATPHDFP
jgi:hypothetical protein